MIYYRFSYQILYKAQELCVIRKMYHVLPQNCSGARREGSHHSPVGSHHLLHQSFPTSSDWSHGLFLYLPVSLEKCSISLAAEGPTVTVWMTDPPLITSEKHLPVLLSCPPVTSIISDPYRCPSFFLMTWWQMNKLKQKQ